MHEDCPSLHCDFLHGDTLSCMWIVPLCSVIYCIAARCYAHLLAALYSFASMTVGMLASALYWGHCIRLWGILLKTTVFIGNRMIRFPLI